MDTPISRIPPSPSRLRGVLRPVAQRDRREDEQGGRFRDQLEETPERRPQRLERDPETAPRPRGEAVEGTGGEIDLLA